MRKKLLILWAMIFAVVIAGTSAVAYASERYVDFEYMPTYRVEEHNAAKTDYDRWLKFRQNSAGFEDPNVPQVRVRQTREGRELSETTAGFEVNGTPLELYAAAYIRNKWGTSAEFKESREKKMYDYGYGAIATAKLSAISFNVKETSHIATLRFEQNIMVYSVQINYGKD